MQPIGSIFTGVFGGLGVLFAGAFKLMFTMNKKGGVAVSGSRLLPL
jgi:hypothetical protein